MEVIFNSEDLSGSEERGHFFIYEEKKVYISKHDLPLILKLSKLPAGLRIKMLSISHEEMEEYIRKEKEYHAKWLDKLLSEKWFFRATGDPAVFDPDWMPIKMTMRQIKLAVKKRKMTLSDMQILIDMFVGERSELYTK